MAIFSRFQFEEDGVHSLHILSMNPLFFALGAVLLCFGVGLLCFRRIKLLHRIKVDGHVVRMKEISSVDMADSMHALVIRYTDLTGSIRYIETPPRVHIGWRSIGDAVPVYVSSDPEASPRLGGFQQHWLVPLCFMGAGLLCLGLAYT